RQSAGLCLGGRGLRRARCVLSPAAPGRWLAQSQGPARPGTACDGRLSQMSLVRRLASQSSLIFGARLAGAGLVFLVQALIARLWGAGVLGEYLIVIAVVNLIAVVMPLGFHT